MMAMTIAAANQRLYASQRSAKPAPMPEPKQVVAAPSADAKPTSGGSVRTAEGKKGEVPDATHKLQKLLAQQEKSMCTTWVLFVPKSSTCVLKHTCACAV